MSSEGSTISTIVWRTFGIFGFAYMLALMFFGTGVESYARGTLGTHVGSMWSTTMWMTGTAIACFMLYKNRKALSSDTSRTERRWLLILGFVFTMYGFKSIYGIFF